MATKKTSKKRTTTAEQKGKAGRASKGKEFDPTRKSRAMSATAEVREPRPYVSRYPIPEKEFQRLKDAADKAKVAKKDATIAKDAGKKRELAGAGISEFAAAGGPVAAAPVSASNFAGIAATGWIPPDCTMATGPNHVMLSVNSSLAVYNKSGGGAVLLRTLTAWFNNVIQGATIFDPKMLFDQHAGRWVLLAVGVSQNPRRSAYLLSVSSSVNPLGPWRNYNLNAMVDGSTATNNWADYPALGVDANNLYITSNQFAFGGGFRYAKIRVVPKAGPYSGGPAPFFDFVNMKNPNNTVAFTIQPCHTFGAPQVEYLVNSLFPGGNSLTVWRLTKSGTSFALSRTSVPTAPYSLPPNAAQRGNNDPLNTGDIRVLHAVFRGDSIWCALTTTHNWGGATNTASIHWFQIRAAAPTLVQQGIFGAGNVHSFYPACCPDGNGNMIMVFSRSGPTEFGSIYYTGRKATEPLGSLQASALLKSGVANYVDRDDGGRNRWGDYNGVCADPANPKGIWFYSEFAAAVNTWGTWVGSASF
ncbi:MAG TPA: hypothetical protein VEW46_18495 [Pyrinomonadaceae bacterium]|nr:hypothetical protein [Pyrinomonadaceae bacterium]